MMRIITPLAIAITLPLISTLLMLLKMLMPLALR
jgi:hypothetical protein